MYYYIVYLHRRNKKLDEVSKALGSIIETLKDSHFEVKEELTALAAPKPLGKRTLAKLEKTFTEKAILTEATVVAVTIEPATPEQISRIKIKKEVINAS